MNIRTLQEILFEAGIDTCIAPLYGKFIPYPLYGKAGLILDYDMALLINDTLIQLFRKNGLILAEFPIEDPETLDKLLNHIRVYIKVSHAAHHTV